MNFGFVGTTEFAASILQDLIENNNRRPQWVITKPDSIAGRGKRLVPPPVKKIADAHLIKVYQPSKIDTTFLDSFPHHNPQLIIVVAYGLILPKEFLQLPSRCCVNIHTSLLPRWRGASPIERAIQAGDAEIGISLIEITEALDAGPIIMQKRSDLSMGETAEDVTPKLNQMSKDILNEYLSDPDAWSVSAQKDSEANYADKITKEEVQIDWTQDAATIARHINAFNLHLGAYSWLGETRIKLLKAIPTADHNGNKLPAGSIKLFGSPLATQLKVVCGKGEIEVLKLQFPGGAKMHPKQVQGKSPLDGAKQFVNKVLSQS